MLSQSPLTKNAGIQKLTLTLCIKKKKLAILKLKQLFWLSNWGLVNGTLKFGYLDHGS
jgi:hypothetical protein